MSIDAGVVVQRRDAAGLVFSRLLYKPRAVLGPHAHRHAYLSFVSSGSYTERLEGVTRDCEASTLLCHAAGERHANVFHDQPVSLLRVEEVGSDLLGQPLCAAYSRAYRGEHALVLCRKMLQELDGSDDLTPLALQGLAYELVAGLARGSRRARSAGPAWLASIDDLLHASFREPPTLAAMAVTAGVHPVHLARTYRKHRRQTIGERIRELRLESACHLLATTLDPIAEIAHGAGFADQSHLARLMRRRLGLSPSEYRAQRARR
jgi:AraC family transcriptional regulator